MKGLRVVTRRVVVFLAAALSISSTATDLPRVLSFDIGGGVPQVVAAEAAVLFAHSWQAGIGYGIVPAIAALTNVQLPTQSFDFSVGGTFHVTPVGTATIDMISPFLRYFPTEGNFYFQLMFSLLRINVAINGTIKDSTDAAIGGVVTGSISMLQPVPTLSIGHIFAGKAYFLNLSLGAAILLNPSTSVTIGGSIPDLLGGNASNTTVFSDIQSSVQSTATQSVRQVTAQYSIIPSFMVTLGIFL